MDAQWGGGPGQRWWAVRGMGGAEAMQEVEGQEEERDLGQGAGEGRATQEEGSCRTTWGREAGYVCVGGDGGQL